ncbi:F-box/LRR-repeat protein At3g59190-like [Rutidosis leptorrhynchoides]|uniref:F-box/LRR-repeat protein At3g59190-like n=1 Tax=Rutidosis leptorrhynchoides TaxID=125765 RepID=UPI003A9A566B
MNLRSGNVVSKRPKHSSSAAAHNNVIKQEEKKNFFNKLPDDLITKIISLISDARDAKRTCILSKRWNYICASILYFVMPFLRYNKKMNEFFYYSNKSVSSSKKQVKKFHDSVDKVLALRHGMPIQKFFLCLSIDYDSNCVLNLLRTVNHFPVQQLELRLAAYYEFMFYWNILEKFNTLIELTLNGKFLLDVRECDSVLFPSLKKLNLIYVVYASEHTLMNLISQCPVLEELSVKKHFYWNINYLKNNYLKNNDLENNDLENNYLETFKVSSVSLKRLSLSLIDYNSAVMVHEVFVDAPNLEYIYILDEVTSKYHMKEPLSLVEAHVDVYRRNLELFTSLSSVKILTLTCQTISVEYMLILRMIYAFNTIDGLTWATPLFLNLVKLLIGINGTSDWEFLLVLLNHMPNLERITFTDGLVHVDQIRNQNCNPPVETPPPSCFLSKLKEITILNMVDLLWEEFAFTKYLLNNATKLEIFKLNAPKINPWQRADILSFSRGSKFCRVEFF